MGFKLTILAGIIAVIAGNYYFKHETVPEHSPVVETRYGKLEGISSTSRDGRTYYGYLGIPYAKPPVGPLRFESPQEPSKWTGVRQAKTFGFECPQFNHFVQSIAGHEDCLFLNVFTPKGAIDGTKRGLPVLVFIHGGLFVFGSGNGYSPDYFLDHDVILVTINYRLGSLGFLNTGDGVVRGNMGLKDQTQALKWIQKNIEFFGGNPGQVTIFGESAGGASVHFQVLSPSSKGLFHGAITQSGMGLNPWAITPNVKEQGKRYVDKLGCTKSKPKEMLECLKVVSVKKILDLQSEARDIFRDPITLYLPSVETVNDEHTFLSEHPRDLLKSGKFNKVPFVIGYNSHEGLLSMPDIFKNETRMKRFDEEFEKVMPAFMFYKTLGPAAQKDMMEMREFYFGKNPRPDDPKKMQNHVSMLTDWIWAVGIQESVKHHATHAPTYAYYYTYKGEFQLAKILMTVSGESYPVVAYMWNALKETINKYVFFKEPVHHGAGHGDELGIQFKMPRVSDITEGHKDYEFSKELVKLWVSIAKQEKPLRFKGQEWTPVDKNPSSLPFLVLDSVSTIVHDPDSERITFMSKYSN